jgi:hypothetical protein
MPAPSLLPFVGINDPGAYCGKEFKKPKKQKEQKPSLNQPWIPMRKGLIIMSITSIAMAFLTAWQVIPSRAWVEGILWGLFFGALILAIFFGNILINRLLRK